MTRLDERTRQSLLALDDPPPGMQARIHQAILASGPPGGGGGESGSGAGGSSGPPGGAIELGFAAKVMGATIGLTAAGVALLALTSAGVRALTRSEPERDPIEVAEARAVESGAVIESPAREDAPEDELELATSAAIEPPPTSSELAPGPSTPRPPSPSSSTLEAELAVIQQARTAKTAAARLTLLDQHRDEFGEGVLADEREVMRVEALCALGRVDEAEQVASAFIAAKPSNPLRSRVEPACPG